MHGSTHDLITSIHLLLDLCIALCQIIIDLSNDIFSVHIYVTADTQKQDLNKFPFSKYIIHIDLVHIALNAVPGLHYLNKNRV